MSIFGVGGERVLGQARNWELGKEKGRWLEEDTYTPLDMSMQFQHGLPLGQWEEAGQEAHDP